MRTSHPRLPAAETARFLVPPVVLLSFFLMQAGPPPCRAEDGRTVFSFLNSAENAEALRMIDNFGCPCGCGRNLPGSSKEPACFGCSVGKAEVSFIAEGLASGLDRLGLIARLSSPVLIDVFADYTDPELPHVWRMSKRVAEEWGQHRVVLRTPGKSRRARRAIRVAECARSAGAFFRVQQALVDHQGPWDSETLVALAAEHGLEPALVRLCLEKMNVRQQIAKDREHAELRGIRSYPALSLNGEKISAGESSLDRAVERILKEESL